MTKFIIIIVVGVLLFSISGKAYCWSLNDIKNSVQQAATNNAPISTSNNTTTQQQAPQQQAVAQPSQPEQPQVVAQQPATQQPAAQVPQDVSQNLVSIDKGVYGVPLKADLATVLKWCADNKVDIQNPTKEQVEEQAKDIMRRIKSIKVDYENNKDSLSESEKQVAAITSDPTIDAMDKTVAVGVQKLLETLNNPSVDYGGKTYLLKKELSEGIQVDGVDKPCMDKRITDSVFSLTVSPSSQSQNLLNQSLSSIEIDFLKDESGAFSSYATIATFNSTGDEFGKQFNILNQVLTQKYGKPSLLTQGMVITSIQPGMTITSIQWRKNIFLEGNDMGIANDTQLLTVFGNSFTANYVEPETMSKLNTLQAKVGQDCKTALSNEDANKAKAMQNNF